nr:acyl-CoA dehydrogenase [Candidatus Bathyarchaeota archaeon]
MDFELAEEQKIVRRTVREFAEREIAPKAREYDEREEFPWEIVEKLFEQGIMGALIPPEYGGSGMDSVSQTIAIEEVARACAGTAMTLAIHSSLCTYAILKYGSDEQKEKFLPKLAKDTVGAFSLTEPEAGSDPSGMRTTATLDGDEYVLNGTKIFVTNGGVAGLVIVFARTPAEEAKRSITAFLVEKGTPGLKVGKKESKLGIRSSNTTELILEDCRVPKENVLGGVGEGYRIALASLDSGRVGIAAQSLGIAQAALDASIRYSKERVQFGSPIARFQAIQWMIADMATEIEAARLLTYKAAYLRGKGERFTKEAAMAKLYASEVAMRAARNAVQIHGGYGFTREYEVERLFRDAKGTEIYEGTSEIQRMVIAGQLLR